jgi:NAD(P)-dependent dehydrogenase (short-subunit alcohol dehydrogenase family)
MALLEDFKPDTQPLTGQVALVTGGGRGLGRAYAQALAKAGAAVAVTARTASELQETVQLIEQNGGRGLAIAADVTDATAVTQLVAAVEQQLGPVDLLVNNAGSLRAIGRVAEVQADDWWRELEINVRGPFLCSQAVLPGMIARRRGRIINLASGAGLNPVDCASAYAVSKAALIRLSENLALETKAYGIAVFAIAPGTVRTPMNDYMLIAEIVQQRIPQIHQWFQQLFAEGRDTPVALSVALILSLASGQADVLSGCMIGVDDNLATLVERAAELAQDQMYTLRLHKLSVARGV